METVGLGVIGVGIQGMVHVRAYASNPQARLVALADLDEQRLAQVGDRFGVAARYADYRRLLERDDIDAVSIATPDFAHTEIALNAARAHKHILLEKPMATSVDECQAIISAAEAAGIKLMVDYHNRWNPPLVQARQRIVSGEIGRPRMFYLRLSNTTYVPLEMLPWAGQSGVSWFLGSHTADALRWLSGAEVVRVYAVSRRELLKSLGVDTPDYFQTILELDSGATAVMENCWILSKGCPALVDFRIEVVAEEGTVHISTVYHDLYHEYTDAEGTKIPGLTGSMDIHGKPSGFMLDAIHHFVRYVLGEAENVCTARDGLEATRIICAIHDSAETGQPVEIRRNFGF